VNLLTSLDTRAFEIVNGKLHNPVLDVVMPFLTTQEHWYPILAGLAIALIVWGGKRGRMAAAMLVIAVALADQVSCSILKPIFSRARPPLALPADHVRLLVHTSEAFSFPSAHAANSFAMASVVAWRLKRLAPLAYAIAAVVAYSRVYVGIHYPLDVIGGAVVGIVAGRVAIWVAVAVVRRWGERARVEAA
jgi:undecaprenyl-diphosphatase